MVKADPKAKLGSGGRFKAVEEAAAKSGASDPAAVAAAAGRKKYGAQKMNAMAAKGRERGKEETAKKSIEKAAAKSDNPKMRKMGMDAIKERANKGK